MNRLEWLLRLRLCTSIVTLEKVIEKNKYDLPDDELERFNAAIDHRPSTIDHRPSTIDHRPSTIDHRPSTIDHRLAELTMGRLYDKVPSGVWKYVK